MSTHTVYMHVDADGGPLYIGCTGNLDKRTAAHRRSAAWWPQVADVLVLAELDKDAALDRERELIRELRPPHNVTHADRQLEAAREAGRAVAATWPPLTDQQIEDAARILAGVARERAQESAA